MKPTTVFSCDSCGAQTPKWAGRCLECGKWGTLKEDRPVASSQSPVGRNPPSAKPGATVGLADVRGRTAARRPTGNADMDRVLGGGLVAGAVVLLAGEPGVGKSTLLLSLASSLHAPILYVAGEESPEQIALRAERLGVSGADIRFLAATDAETVAATAEAERPALLIVDSIQSVRAGDADAGTVAGVRTAGAIIAEAAKRSGVPVVLVGQVTKDGAIAGPKTLEHLVDAVLSFSGDASHGLRMLRAEKNRFGSADEVAVFRMTERGLLPEPNPSKLLLADRRPDVPGSAVACVLEGSQPLLLEVQALVTKSAYGTPVRRASGVDQNRLHMLLAVLEKRAGVSLAGADVHVNVVGGLDARDPGADLAVALAVASAAADRPLPDRMLLVGEVGLGGEIRAAGRMEKRLAEASALGFTSALAPRDADGGSVAVTAVRDLTEAIRAAGLLK